MILGSNPHGMGVNFGGWIIYFRSSRMQIHCLEQDLKEKFWSWSWGRMAWVWFPIFYVKYDPGVEPPWYGYDLPIGTLYQSRPLEIELYILGQVECKYTF